MSAIALPGGACFHVIPEGLAGPDPLATGLWSAGG